MRSRKTSGRHRAIPLARGRALLAALACGALLAVGGASCRSSAGVRPAVVETLGRVAKGYKHMDPAEVLAEYDEGFVASDAFARARVVRSEIDGVLCERSTGVVDRESLRQVIAERIGRFADIQKAKYVVDDVREMPDGTWEVDAWFNLLARKPGGVLYHDESWHRLRLVERDGRFRIREARVLERTEVEGKAEDFVDRTEAVGLAVTHRPHATISESTPVIPGNFSGSGAAAGDVDGDGYLDLVVGDGVRSQLYRNRGDGTFEDVTESAGLGEVAKVRGAYLVDYDDDGRLDIFFTRVKASPRLFRNAGGFRFEDRSELLEGVVEGQGESAAFADLDGDGDLDAYVVQYGDYEEASWAYPIYDSTDGQRSVVLRNEGEGRLEPVDDPALTPPGWGLAVAMADYDDDGDQDIYLVNDFGVNHLLRNEGDFRFTAVEEEAGVVDQGFGMGASFGDYDGDGDLDLYVSNMHSSARWVFDDPDFPLPTIADVLMLRRFVRNEMNKVLRGNSFFENQGDGTFVELAGEKGVERAGWAWGAQLVDYDNDGDLDIYCPNGFISGERVDDL